MSGLTVVFGAGSVGDAPYARIHSVSELQPYLNVCKKHHITHLDTAVLYSGSEKVLGEASAGVNFIIDTKNPGGAFGHVLSTENLIKEHETSLAELKADSVDILYIHAPDDKANLEAWLPGMNQICRDGLCKRFGLSNFTAAQVRDIHNHCKREGYVLPSAYQGNYNAVARRADAELFPTLRELNISFYAYSPLAGGFLTKTKQQILDGAGRFNQDTMIGKLYSNIYARPSYLDGLAEWENIAQEANISRAELAYRWISYHSPLSKDNGDAFIVGASSLQQLEQTLVGLERGPLSRDTVSRIDGVWEKVKHEATLNNVDAFEA